MQDLSIQVMMGCMMLRSKVNSLLGLCVTDALLAVTALPGTARTDWDVLSCMWLI